MAEHLLPHQCGKEAHDSITMMRCCDANELAHVLRYEHRTHQQSFVRNLVKTLQIWHQIQDGQTDQRNQEAIGWLSDVASMSDDSFFPFV